MKTYSLTLITLKQTENSTNEMKMNWYEFTMKWNDDAVSLPDISVKEKPRWIRLRRKRNAEEKKDLMAPRRPMPSPAKKAVLLLQGQHYENIYCFIGLTQAVVPPQYQQMLTGQPFLVSLCPSMTGTDITRAVITGAATTSYLTPIHMKGVVMDDGVHVRTLDLWNVYSKRVLESCWSGSGL